MDNLYRYSPFNWIIETKYDQENLSYLVNFLETAKGVSYKFGLSTSGNSNQYWFLGKGANYSKNKSFIKISKTISKIAKEQLNKYELLSEDIYLKPGNSWTVVGSKGSFHKLHDHGNNFGLCTIVYTKVPEIIKDDEGCVYFIMSNDIRVSSYTSVPKVISIKPEFGKMIIFPSHILHGVYPYPEGLRQSFNLDFHILPLDQKKMINYEYN